MIATGAPKAILVTDGSSQPWIATVVSESMEKVMGPESVCRLNLEPRAEVTIPNTPETSGSFRNMTGRTRVSVSPATDVATTSITIGPMTPERSISIENRPSVSGKTKRPFTLRVASGAVMPVTEIRSRSVTRFVSGELSRNIRAWL